MLKSLPIIIGLFIYLYGTDQLLLYIFLKQTNLKLFSQQNELFAVKQYPLCH